MFKGEYISKYKKQKRFNFAFTIRIYSCQKKMNVTRNTKMNNVKWKSTNMNPTY